MGPLLPFSVPPVSQNSRVAFVKDFYALGGGFPPFSGGERPVLL